MQNIYLPRISPSNIAEKNGIFDNCTPFSQIGKEKDFVPPTHETLGGDYGQELSQWVSLAAPIDTGLIVNMPATTIYHHQMMICISF